MNEKPNRRPRFTLRTLLVVVALAGMASAMGSCAYHQYRRLTRIVPQADLDRVEVGMTCDQVRTILGEHNGVQRSTFEGHEYETWTYGFFDVLVEFKDGKCIKAEKS